MTQIDATKPESIVARFRGRKDRPTQNVIAIVTPNKQICYVMDNWEGLAHDFTMLKSALSLPASKGLRLLRDNINNQTLSYIFMILSCM